MVWSMGTLVVAASPRPWLSPGTRNHETGARHEPHVPQWTCPLCRPNHRYKTVYTYIFYRGRRNRNIYSWYIRPSRFLRVRWCMVTMLILQSWLYISKPRCRLLAVYPRQIWNDRAKSLRGNRCIPQVSSSIQYDFSAFLLVEAFGAEKKYCKNMNRSAME